MNNELTLIISEVNDEKFINFTELFERDNDCELLEFSIFNLNNKITNYLFLENEKKLAENSLKLIITALIRNNYSALELLLKNKEVVDYCNSTKDSIDCSYNLLYYTRESENLHSLKLMLNSNLSVTDNDIQDFIEDIMKNNNFPAFEYILENYMNDNINKREIFERMAIHNLDLKFLNLFLKLYPSFVFYSDFPLTTLFRNKQYEHFEKCISFFKIKEPVLPLVMLKNHKSKANYIFNSNEKKCISLFFKKMFQVGKFTPEILEKIINIEIKTITKKLYLSEKIREF